MSPAEKVATLVAAIGLVGFGVLLGLGWAGSRKPDPVDEYRREKLAAKR